MLLFVHSLVLHKSNGKRGFRQNSRTSRRWVKALKLPAAGNFRIVLRNFLHSRRHEYAPYFPAGAGNLWLTGGRKHGTIWLVTSPGRPYACVAQLVEQLTRNEQVAGSSPATSSKRTPLSLRTKGFFIIAPFKLPPLGTSPRDRPGAGDRTHPQPSR